MKCKECGKTLDNTELLETHWDLRIIAELFCKLYPEDIFQTKPVEIITIREGFKKILEKKGARE